MPLLRIQISPNTPWNPQILGFWEFFQYLRTPNVTPWSLHKNIHTFLFYSLICRHSLFLLPVCWWLWWSLKRNQCQFQHHLHSSLAFKLLDLATSSKSFLELVTQHQDSLVLLENVFDDGKNKTLKTQTIVGNYFRCKIKS